MKLIIYFVLLLYISPLYCEKIGSWTQVLERENSTNMYYGISMADSMNGMILGRLGTLIYVKKTTDAGNNWEFAYTENRIYANFFETTNIEPHHIAYPDKNSCYVTLDSGNIIKTLDGGASWEKINIAEEQLKSLVMFDKNIGAISTFKSIYLTKDGWNSWKKANLPEKLDIKYYFEFNISMSSKNNIIAQIWNHDQYFILMTENFGKDWNLYPLGFKACQDIKFMNDSLGFACSDRYYTDTVTNKPRSDAKIIKTRDGGKTWGTVFDSSYFSGFRTLDIKQGAIYSVGPGARAFMSIDTGNTWINIREYEDYANENGYMWIWCSAINKDEFLVQDNTMGIWKFSNRILSVENGNVLNNNLRISPNPSTDYINVKGGCGLLSIYNIIGEIKLTLNYNGQDIIDVSTLPIGFYLLRIGEKSVKFIKK